jgi:hypothetical protein
MLSFLLEAGDLNTLWISPKNFSLDNLPLDPMIFSDRKSLNITGLTVKITGSGIGKNLSLMIRNQQEL